MTEKIIRFGVIGCGLMAREFASATQRWAHLTTMDVRPRLVAVADAKDSCLCWFTDNMCDITTAVTDYRELLANPEVDAVYCAVPHHLHTQIYGDIIRAGKHLLGEKPFGIDLAANEQILAVLRRASAGLRALLVGVSLLPRCLPDRQIYPGRALRQDHRGRERSVALQRSGPQQADQLEAHVAVQRRVRLPG